MVVNIREKGTAVQLAEQVRPTTRYFGAIDSNALDGGVIAANSLLVSWERKDDAAL